MSDEAEPVPLPPPRPNTDGTFKHIQESGGSKPRPGMGEVPSGSTG